MTDWQPAPPPAPELLDRDVPRLGDHLAGKRVALMVTGGIAAMKAPFIARALRRQGAEVVAFTSEEALRYVTADTLEWSTANPVVSRLSARAEHLSDAAPFDAYLVAPATYNTINKLRHGIADGPLTATLASALGRLERGQARVLVAPTMHGTMHTAILTESLEQLARLGVRLIEPRPGYGKHNIPDEAVLVAAVCRAVASSPLAGQRMLVTGGPTPVPIDSVRRITNVFRGSLGIEIALELHLRGADVFLVHGTSGVMPPAHLPHFVVHTYDEYRQRVDDALAAAPHRAAIFSAAVADYAPRQVLPGKTPSGGALASLELRPLAKVVEQVRRRHPALHMVTFKYQEDISHDELMAIGRERLALYEAVVANRGDEHGPDDEQVAYLLTRGGGEPDRLIGKPVIARAIADHLERVVRRDASGAA